MITCRECLVAVSTGGYAEMQPTTEAGLHSATCADCARVITDVRERESRVAEALAQLRMTASPAEVAREAVASRRRQTAHFWRMGLIIALIATTSIGVVNWLIPGYERAMPVTFGDELVTETIPLSCISPQQATELGTPFLRSGGPAIYAARDIPAVTLRGVQRELTKAKAAILEFDVKCQLPRATTKGKD